MSGNRLITNMAKKSWHRGPFTPHGSRLGYIRYLDYLGYLMCDSEDFFTAGGPPDQRDAE